jgi:hypothetical protein
MLDRAVTKAKRPPDFGLRVADPTDGLLECWERRRAGDAVAPLVLRAWSAMEADDSDGRGWLGEAKGLLLAN